MAVAFEDMNLDAKLLQAIETQGFSTPTEIQKRAIPLILQGKDLLATAETGSGKTAAFILPILMRIIEPRNRVGRGPSALILAPTRELVDQIALATRQLSKGIKITFGTIIGGVPYFHQEQLLRKPLDLLIATPGRLLDHMDKGRVDFSNVELFVLDEADRMLDMGFIKDIEMVCHEIPKQHQTLLFSATLNPEIQKIARKLLNDPVHLELAVNAKPHALISQQIHQVNDYKHKCDLLFHILEDQKVWQAIVFTKTKRGAEKVADELKSKRIACAHLHGDMKQGQRTRTIDRMHRGELRVLVATDVAGRGLDIKNLTHVLNFDLPSKVEDYIHRIGRTGRSGESGTAISLVDSTGWSLIHRIEKFIGQRLERRVISGLEPKQAETNKEPGNRKFHKNFKKANNDSNFRKNGSNGSNFRKRTNDSSNFRKRDNDGSNFRKRTNDGSNFKKRDNDGSNFKKRDNDGSNFKKRDNDGSNFKKRDNDGSNFRKRTNDGSNFRKRTNDDSNFRKRTNDSSNFRKRDNDGSNFKKRDNDGSNFRKRTNDDSNFKQRTNDGSNFKQRTNDGSNSKKKATQDSNFKSHKEDFRNSKKRYGNKPKTELSEQI